jgi:hypothetical protein
MELDKILYNESSLRNFYNYTIKFPTEEKYIQRDLLCSRVSKWNKYYVIVSGWNNYYVVEFPGGIIIM